MTDSEQLHLNWEKFDANLKSSYAGLRETPDFSDVTLVSADGKQINAHKVILATASSFFFNILNANKHPHPLIFMKGLEWTDLSDIIDFIYHGEVNVMRHNLTQFLEIANEIQLKGLSRGSYTENNEKKHIEEHETYTGEKLCQEKKETHDLTNLKEDETNIESIKSENDTFSKNTEAQQIDLTNSFPCIHCPNRYKLKDSLNMHIWRKHKKNKNMMDEEYAFEHNQISQSSDLIEDNSGTLATTDDMLVFIDGIWKCVVCNKKSNGKRKWDMIAHVETHMEGLSYQCKFCPTIARSRGARNSHVYRKHSAKAV